MLDNGNIHPLRLAIMGINTHVNADIWQTMVVNFTPEEILRYRKPFLACQRSIARIYSPLFDAAASKSFYIRLMRVLTFGSVKKLGELILYKWRLTQEKLALLYFRDPERFCRKRARVNQKKERLDRRLVSGFSLLLPRDP